jgi:molybdopterin molybdotransferase
MINSPEARNIILSSVHPVGSIMQSIERSLHRFLAEDVIASENIPPFDNSAMDGYAVTSEDVRQIPRTLTIAGEIAAGAAEPSMLKKGEAVSIMTGAKIPKGCDAVVPLEWTELVDEKHVKILRSVESRHNIRASGTDIERGEIALRKHQRLRPQEIGVLASLGKQFVEVYRPPTVAILATGNELVNIAAPLSEGHIRNSNAYALSALLKERGCEPVMLEIARDDRKDLKEKIIKGLASDVLITTGGVSVGKYDLVVDVMKEVGVEIKFWKVNIKPGMPMIFGMYGEKPVFGLPGNPVSSLVTFLQFVNPAIEKMLGSDEANTIVKIPARIEHDIMKPDGKRHFIRGILEQRNGSIVVHSTGSQVSNILSSLTKANCLIILPEEVTHVTAGDIVEVELL